MTVRTYGTHGFDHGRTERDVRNEMTVHDIDMDPVGALVLDRDAFAAEIREICREDRRGDLDRAIESSSVRLHLSEPFFSNAPLLSSGRERAGPVVSHTALVFGGGLARHPAPGCPQTTSVVQNAPSRDRMATIPRRRSAGLRTCGARSARGRPRRPDADVRRSMVWAIRTPSRAKVVESGMMIAAASRLT